MSKILISSDLHVHPHKKSADRLKDCLNALEWIFQTADKEKINTLVFAGDLFHDRQKIDVLTYQRIFELFRKYMDNKTVYLLLGNHDMWHYSKWDISSVYPLSSIDGVKVVAEPTTLDILDHQISFLPYTHDPDKDLKSIKNDSKYKVLFGHVAIDGAVWNVTYGTTADVSIEHDGDMKKVSADIFEDWNQVFLGHYHAKQELKTESIDGFCVEYIGSPLQLDFGEAFQNKEIIIYDLESHDKKYVRNKFSPQHYVISPKEIEKYNLENNFVQILVDDIASSDLVDMKNDILKDNKVGSLEIKQVIKKKQDDQKIIEDAKAILHKEDEMLESYIKSLSKEELGDLDPKILIEKGREIIFSESE